MTSIRCVLCPWSGTYTNVWVALGKLFGHRQTKHGEGT